MKYWVYINGEVPGSFTTADLANLPGFGAATLICPAEGEILEKNWRHASEFPEVAPLLEQRSRKSPELPAAASLTGGELDSLLDGTSERLFRHVTELMKELENRREERALNLSLARQAADLKDQLQGAREKTALLESRVSALVELEESARKSQAQIQALEEALKQGEEAQAEIRVKLQSTKNELEGAKRRASESANDLAIRNRLVDRLSRELTEKEMMLAKALAVVRRFEENLGRLCPEAALKVRAEESRPAAPAAQPAPADPASANIGKPAPAAEQPQAQNALAHFLKRHLPVQH